MNKLLTLKKRLAEAINGEEALLSKIIEEARAATEEEEKSLAAFEASRKATSDLIQRQTKIEADKAELGEVEEEERGAAPKIKMGKGNNEDEKGQYRGFKSFGEQLQAIHRAAKNPMQTDKRLLELNERAAAGMNEGVGADGGFLLQDDYSSEILTNAVNTGLIAPRCRAFPTSPGSTGVSFPVINETSRVDGSRWGGVQVYRVNEATAPTLKKLQFTQQRLGFEKLMGMCVVSDELLGDATFLGSWVQQAFTEEFSVKIDNEIIRGSGAAQMLGVLNANCTVSVDKETSQAARTIVGMNCVNMFARLFARSQSSAVWLANQDCFPQIATLTITKDKSDIPIYQPANIAAGQTLGTILGRPVVYVEQCSTLGTVGDLILGDFSRYMIIQKDPKQASSIHVYFDTEQTAFRISQRNNGMPMLKQAITPMNGTNTLTDFVTLAVRA